tara:strand:+ start:4482 stop:5105 length:624 start_codon:yes stop_codon:yes gene_type:complete
MAIEKDIIKLYIKYLSKKYDDNIKSLNIDINAYKLDNNSYKGVQSHRNNKFRVQLSYKGAIYSLGVFSDKKSAAKKYALVHKLLSESKIYGGKLTFNVGSEDENCKTDEDCKDSFPNSLENSKNVCNTNTGMCENVIEVSKYIEPEEEEEEVKPKKKQNKKKSQIKKSRCPNGTKKSSTGKTCRKKLSKCKKGSRRSKSGKSCLKNK